MSDDSCQPSNRKIEAEVDVDEDSATAVLYDVVVIGGGVVGLAVLRAAVLAGYKQCCLLEQEASVLTWASGSNSGIVCTGVDAAPNSLERALIRDAISQIRIYCETMNVPFRPCGSLVCQWPWDNNDDACEAPQNDSGGDSAEETNLSTTALKSSGHHRLRNVLLESHAAGDTHATLLSTSEVLQREPHLNPVCQGAVHIPGEIVLDPWLYSVSLATHARENGALIFTHFKVDTVTSGFDKTTRIWTLNKQMKDKTNESLVTPTHDPCRPSRVRARAVINATGVWSDLLQEEMICKDAATTAKGTANWKAQPRRGQYRVFQAPAHSSLQQDCSSSNNNDCCYYLTHPIQPIPTERTKGIFVFGSFYNQIIVGPTAEDQDSRTDRSINEHVSQQLEQHAHRILPKLQADASGGVVGDYVGIRPGTDRRDYQIHVHYPKQWIAVAGIRSTGLTASLGIGRHIVHLLGGLLPQPLPLKNIQTTPLPPVRQLVREYHERNDGTVTIGGHVYQVTHPITRFGWDARTGLAAS